MCLIILNMIVEKIEKELPSVQKVPIWTKGKSSECQKKYKFVVPTRCLEHYPVDINWNCIIANDGKGTKDSFTQKPKKNDTC